MGRFHRVDGVDVPFTAEEETARDAEEAAWAAGQAERDRHNAVDAIIVGDTTMAALKAMTNQEFETWWSMNMTTRAQENTLLKQLARVIIRRVLR